MPDSSEGPPPVAPHSLSDAATRLGLCAGDLVLWGPGAAKLERGARPAAHPRGNLATCYGDLPVCIARTQNSRSDDPRRRGRPVGFDLTVRGLQINAGAGFPVVLTGEILRMPALPRRPLAERSDLKDGAIVGFR